MMLIQPTLISFVWKTSNQPTICIFRIIQLQSNYLVHLAAFFHSPVLLGGELSHRIDIHTQTPVTINPCRWLCYVEKGVLGVALAARICNCNSAFGASDATVVSMQTQHTDIWMDRVVQECHSGDRRLCDKDHLHIAMMANSFIFRTCNAVDSDAFYLTVSVGLNSIYGVVMANTFLLVFRVFCGWH